MAQPWPAFKIDAPAGSYGVGVSVVEQYDYSRTFQPPIDNLGRPYSGQRARPIQTLLWYPARKGSGKPVTFGDYVALGDTEASFGRPRGVKGPANYFASGMTASAGEVMAAVRDAAPISGRFPVVIYAPSFSSSAWENADLCEYLASFGYVVIASPGMGVGYESTHDLAGVEAQARDISFLVGYAQALANADASHLAVLGFSWGGLSNLFAAAQDDRIKALVDLDGSIRYWPGLVKSAADLDPSQMTIPLLYFKSAGTLEDQAKLEERFKSAAGPSVLDAWTAGDLISIQMLEMIHPEFGAATYRNRNFWTTEFSHLQYGDYDREDGIQGFSWAARYTKEFLDYYLKQNPDGLRFLKARPADVGVPKHVLAVSFRPGTGRPFDLAAFRVEVGRLGFDHIAEAYQAAQKAHPRFTLASGDLLPWAMDLLSDGHSAESVAVAKLAVQMDPSSDAYSVMGAAYLGAGRISEAVSAYRQALQRDPGNLLVQSALRQIEAGQRP
jgi:tetratricopeptide (TPR) repeat protein